MNVRMANMQDLPQLKAVYRDIIEHMNENDLQIWDDVYPCEFFMEDIEKKRLYLMTEGDDIVAAFVLSESNVGENFVTWASEREKALYLDRFGVNVHHLRKGVGSLMIQEALAIAKNKGARYLRLFAVDCNQPAINLYLKNGFRQVNGYFDQSIGDRVLHEFGFEIGIVDR